MSGPAFVVMPVEPGGAQASKEETERITEVLRQGLYEQQQTKVEESESEYEEDGQPGPLKELLAESNSLYKYISWENTTTTISSYFLALGTLIGLHYLPLTKYALKTGTIVLGAISITEWANRAFGPDTILARLRPKEYKKVPESTLNATLKDVHDFIQYSITQAQRILYGEDLNKSFLAFFVFATMYWLAGIASPFTWAILALNAVYLAPLVLSPRGRAVGEAAVSLSGDLANAAVSSGKSLAQDAGARVSDQYSKAQDVTQKAAKNTSQRVGGIVENSKQTAGNMYENGKQRAGNIVDQGKQTANNLSARAGNMYENGKQTTGNLVGQGQQTASDMSNRAGNMYENGKQTTGNMVGSGKQTANNLSDRATNVVSGSNKHLDGNAMGPDGSATATGSFHVDNLRHQQHLNSGQVGPQSDTAALNQSGYQTSYQSNVVERNPLS